MRHFCDCIHGVGYEDWERLIETLPYYVFRSPTINGDLKSDRMEAVSGNKV